MESKVRFSGPFQHKMFLLALISGLIISISMPLTFFSLSIYQDGRYAILHSEEIANKLVDVVKENPDFWQYSAQKLTKTFAEFYQDPYVSGNFTREELLSINVYDQTGRLIDQEIISQSAFPGVTGRAKIIYNNRTFGYVEIVQSTSNSISLSLLLLLGFSVLGFLVAFSLYRFPVRIVKKAEKEIDQAFQRLRFLSYYDQLTELPNRVHFRASLDRSLQIAQQNNTKVAVIFLDLDRFKIINDTLGHNHGDLVLRAVASRLTSCMREDDIVARVGGDEFTLVVKNIRENQEAARVAERILHSLAEPFIVNGRDYSVTSSIGISIYPIRWY